MKVIIELDKDQIIGMLALLGAKKDEKEAIKSALAEKEEIELESSLFEKDEDLDLGQIYLAIATFVIMQLSKELHL